MNLVDKAAKLLLIVGIVVLSVAICKHCSYNPQPAMASKVVISCVAFEKFTIGHKVYFKRCV